MVLHDMGMTQQSFLAAQRENVLRRQLVDTVSGDVTLPQAWLDAINQFQNQARSIQYVSLGSAQAGDIPQPTDEQLSKYFDDRKILFRAPEYRKIDTVTVTPAALAQWMQISDDDVKKAYDEQHASFVTPEKRHVEQIVFPQMTDAQKAASANLSDRPCSPWPRCRDRCPAFQAAFLGKMAKLLPLLMLVGGSFAHPSFAETRSARHAASPA